MIANLGRLGPRDREVVFAMGYSKLNPQASVRMRLLPQAVIARLDRATQYSTAVRSNREAAAYWIPRIREV